MGVIDYSLNGKQFRQNKIFISGGFRTLFSELKLRETKGYTWKNMNGIKTDPSEKPVFEPREITLSGWVEGDSWEQMKENFNAVMIDLTKAGTQRLICDAYGKKTIVCDVKLKDGFPLLEGKTKDGKNIGVFTLKLVEENPIKKILYTESSNLQLSFLSPKMVTVNIDGKAQQAKGNVVINKTLSIRPYNKIQIGGRNLVFGTSQPRTLYTTSLNESYFEYDTVLLEPNSEYTISFYHAFDPTCKGMQVYVSFKNPDQIVLFKELPPTNSQWGQKQVFQFTTDGSSHALCKVFVYNMGSKDGANAGVAIKELKIEKGNKATDWVPAPEDQHYISIAGNIDEITNLNTNAAVLWEILL